MADRPREVLRFEHADMRDDVVIIAAYDDLGIRPAVVFDGGGFMDPSRLRAYALDLLKAADWLAEQHPEEACRRCGGPNVSWSAPSPLWNAVMRGGSIDGPWEFNELICPTCFVVLAEERGIATGWTVDAETVHVELETVTPSGRRWDPHRRLWIDPLVVLTPVPGEMVPERNADPWPKNLEGPDGLSLRFRETDGNQLAIYLNDAAREDRQVDVYRVDGTYRMDTSER